MSAQKSKRPTTSMYPWKAAIPTLLVIGLGGIYHFAREDVNKLVGQGLLKAADGAKELGLTGKANERMGRQEPWSSDRPILADVDGDGRNELFSVVHTSMFSKYAVQCMSNTDWSLRWSTKIGDNKDALGVPQLRWLPEQKLLVTALGATIRALDPKTGEERWVAKGTDKVDKMGIAQGVLLVNTIDEKKLAISAQTGEVLPASYQWPNEWTYLASDKEGQVLRSGDGFREDAPEFKEIRVEDTYCAADRVKVVQQADRVVGRCTDTRGIAYAERAKGTEFPFLVSYDRKTKKGLWRLRLSEPDVVEVLEHPPLVTFSYPHDKADSVFAAFLMEDDPEVRLARVSLKSGEMQALSSYTTSRRSYIQGISTDEHYLYMRVDQALLVLDPKEGDIVKQLGVIYKND